MTRQSRGLTRREYIIDDHYLGPWRLFILYMAPGTMVFPFLSDDTSCYHLMVLLRGKLDGRSHQEIGTDR